MEVLNEVIGGVIAARPPARDIDDDAMRVRKLPVPDMHAFIQSEVNIRRRRMTSLPPPEQWVLSKMNEMEVAEMIEEHIDFYTEDKDGNRRSVHLPTPFVRHFMRRHDGVAADRGCDTRRRPSSWRTESCWHRTASIATAASSSSSRMSCGRLSRRARTAPRSA